MESVAANSAWHKQRANWVVRVFILCLLLLGFITSALSIRGTEVVSNKAKDYLDLGVREYKAQHLREAEKAFRKAVELDPAYVTALYNLGRVLMDQPGKEKEAGGYFRRVFELRPNKVDNIINLSTLLMADSNSWLEAEQILLHAAAISPDDADVHSNLGNLYGRMLEYQKGEIYARRALALEPKNVNFKYNLATLLAMKGGDTSEAERLFREILIATPNDGSAMRNLGMLLAKRPDGTEEAKQLLTRSIEIRQTGHDLKNSDAELLDQYAVLLAKDAKTRLDAEKYLLRAIELNPALGSAYEHLGDLLAREQKRGGEACRAWQKALTVYEKNGETNEIQRLNRDIKRKSCLVDPTEQ